MGSGPLDLELVLGGPEVADKLPANWRSNRMLFPDVVGSWRSQLTNGDTTRSIKSQAVAWHFLGPKPDFVDGLGSPGGSLSPQEE